jgi:hypothetical protein
MNYKIDLKITGAVLQSYDKEIMTKTNSKTLEWTDEHNKNKTEFTVKKHKFVVSFSS